MGWWCWWWWWVVGGDYYHSLLKDILGVLFDSFHKPNFKMHATILARLFNIVETGAVTVPLWKGAPNQFPNNQTYVRAFVCNLLATNYKNLNK
jgi:exportin-1